METLSVVMPYIVMIVSLGILVKYAIEHVLNLFGFTKIVLTNKSNKTITINKMYNISDSRKLIKFIRGQR